MMIQDVNIKIALADSSQKKELIELWSEAFGDDESFISQFIDAYMIPEYNVPIALYNGKIVGVLYLIDFDLYSNLEKAGMCSYMFAATTHKGYRGRGIMAELIKFAAELYRNRGIKAIFLFPQDQDAKLFEYYSKFGFKTIYKTKKIHGGAKGHARDIKRDSDDRDNGLFLQEENIKDEKILDELYNAYIEFAAKQALMPIKDRFFYFKCTSVYLDSPERDTHFAIFKNNTEKFCYVFYKKSKNAYRIDDIIFLEEDKFSHRANRRPEIDEIIELLEDYIKSHGGEYEINALPVSTTDDDNSPLAMVLPLDRKIAGVIENLKIPIYLNMFMNL